MSQAHNLQRVSDNISDVVLRFCKARIGRHFHAEALVQHVMAFTPKCAPDSPSRILRELRRQGRVDYVVVNRAASLYRVVAVRP
jgi:hypothetical protein